MSKILCVDLDGTLLHTDSLQEAMFCFIKANPLRLLLLLMWLCRGRAYLKQQLACRVSIDPAVLPYNTELLAWLRQCKAEGQLLVLVTATDRHYAELVAKHLDIFDEVLASDGHINLRAHQKAAALTQRFGTKGYDYAGNSHDDLVVWEQADGAIVVNASKAVLRKAKKRVAVRKVFARPILTWRAFLKAIRVHQYAKNILIFLPLLASHMIFNLKLLSMAGWGFISFCLMASSVYVLNDLLDLSADRKHPTKSQRAIASGLLPIPKATLLIFGFLMLAISVALYLPVSFLWVLLLYFGLTLAYSFWLKQIVLVDVITLSLLYTCRIVAGMTLLGNAGYSQWMLLLSLFLFLSLAFLKRVSELYLLNKKGYKRLMGRDYHTADILTFTIFGITCGLMAILVFALYLNSSAALALYQYPQRLLLVFPFMLYWLCRIWLLATQGKVQDDPVLYSIRDKASYGISLIILLIFLWAMR